jgi:hypothetical protein
VLLECGKRLKEVDGAHVVPNPVQYERKSKFVAGHCIPDEGVGCHRFDKQNVSVRCKERVGQGEGDPLIAVDEWMIVRERLHQRRSLFKQVLVVAALRAKDRELEEFAIANSVRPAETVDQIALNRDRFGDGRVVMLRHLLREEFE